MTSQVMHMDRSEQWNGLVADRDLNEAVRRAKQDLRDLTQHYRHERQEQIQKRRSGVLVLWVAIVAPGVLFLTFLFR
jgi:hypothetical protein